MINRRSLLVGLITAPAIVRAGLIMPIKVIEPVRMMTLNDYYEMINKSYEPLIKQLHERLTNHILYGGNDNVGLAFFVKDQNIRVEGIARTSMYRTGLI